MRWPLLLLDRTVVLFLGLAAGALIALAFVDDKSSEPATPSVIVPAGPAVAPPPPTGTTQPATATRAKGGRKVGAGDAGGKPTGPAAPAIDETTPVAALVVPPGTPRLPATIRAGRPVTIGVFGDSFGDGVWFGLHAQLTKKSGFDVVKFSQQATGFTRYRSLNLETHSAQQIADTPIDIAVISFGANDTQGIYANGHVAPLMSPAWQAEIGRRVAGLVGMLRSKGASVYWVGLPRMRKAAFDADIANMNAFYVAQMRALGVPFIDTRPTSSGPDGGYAPYLPDPATGKQTLMRAEDGIHMSMTGYIWITRGLADRIRQSVASARAQAGIAPPAPAIAPAAAEKAS